MAKAKIFYVGATGEVEHHAAPLTARMPIQIVDSKEVMRIASPGDLAIFFSEHFERFRNAIRQLQRRSVGTLYAIDGILEWRNAWENRIHEPASPWTMRPVLCDKVACIGASQQRVLAAWGNAGKTEVTGIPRLDGLKEGKPSSKACDRFRVLVMTAKCPGFTDTQRQQITQSMMDLRDFFDANESVEGMPIDVTWRLTDGLDREIGIENRLADTKGEDLAAALGRVDATITTPSTTQLESMLSRKPTAIIDYTNSPAYVDAAWRITAQNQIQHVLRQLADPAEARMHYQDSLLDDALQIRTNATDRMLTLIESMSALAADCASRGQAPKFPSAMLPSVQGHAPELSHFAAYENQDAFKNNDLLALQTELADAKRENELLSQLNAGLREELGQAHRIFDTIHSHPIAGPVVRTRQRVIDWFATPPEKSSENR